MLKGIPKKTIIGLAVMCSAALINVAGVRADTTLDKNSVVWVTETGTKYHLTDECGNTNKNTVKAKTLNEVLSKGMKMCETCAKNFGMNIEDSQNLTLDMLPYHISGDGSSSSGNSNGNNGAGESNKLISEETSSSGEETKQANSSKNNSKTNKTTAKSSAGNSTGSSDSGTKELMSDKQRRNSFLSKTNPKRGQKPVTIPRVASAGFSYADFATFNSYNSENGLGGAPIYLLGTIMDIRAVKQSGSKYALAVMVNDCDGYQWYMRCNCDKSNYELLKAELQGKSANIYGTYAGYSGVTNRPMMDMMRVFETRGVYVDLELYK